MKIGDIYVSKTDRLDIIQIDSYAFHMDNLKEDNWKEKFIIVYQHIEKHNEYEIGSCPSKNGYGSQEEIEEKYELLVSQEELQNYSDWNEIFKLIEEKESD